MRSTMIEDRADKVKSLSEVARDVVKGFHERAQAGEFDQATAQALAIKALRNLRYSGAEYYFIYKMDGTNVLLPPKPEREGKNFIDLKDENGVHFIRELLESGGKNGRPVFYQFPRAGSDKPVDKVAAAITFEPWEWSIGTGIYIDDVNDEFFGTALKFAAIIGPITMILMVGGWFLARNIAVPLRRLVAVTGRLAEQDFSVEISGTERGDEIGVLGRSVRILRDEAREAADLRRVQEKDKQRAEDEKHRVMSELADHFELSVKGVVETVASAATEMQGTAQSLSSVAEHATRQATTVAAASEEATTNVQTVASAAEELSSSIREISRQVNAAAGISSNAVAQ
ncbi:MAG TPA: methyl-accepting chemotaxis protein, partial [Telmatospirillum sp.]|nr:methyl-accepting chemotaxis protein [Telmatospirillum sp.]